ncbi:APC family permease [Microbacterium yannicii]|uniref:APC family permease n=1 Tax=Microbacterium yannicii TaxID=671622 RepID=UPI000319F5B1|nr:APC family permease [Microbacterium yannicii]
MSAGSPQTPPRAPGAASALGQAILEHRPSSILAETSPLRGLRRGSVRTVDLVAQSVAAVAPAGVLLTSSGGLAAHAGSFAFIALALTACVVVLVALSISVFARRLSAAGGLYTFVTRGLGPVIGMLAGAAIALGYATVAIDTLRSGVRRLTTLFVPAATGGDRMPDLGVFALILVCTIGLVGLIVCGARVSTRIMLVIEIVAVAAILVISVVVFASTGWDLEPLIPDPSSPPALSSFAAAAGVALVSFVGFESGAALGPESRRPLASVPRALVWTVVAVAIVYLFGVAAQLSARADGSLGRTSSLLAEAASLDAAWIGPAVDAVVAASWIACTLACTNALVRLVFTMARERVLPEWLGRTSRRFSTPHRAAIAVGLILAGGTVVQTWAGGGSLLDEVIGLGTSVGFIVAYLIVCAAAVTYLVRVKEFSLREAWPAMLGTLALAALTATEIVGTEGRTRVALLVIAAVLAAVVAGYALALRRGALPRARPGAYDTPVAADALGAQGERPHGA